MAVAGLSFSVALFVMLDQLGLQPLSVLSLLSIQLASVLVIPPSLIGLALSIAVFAQRSGTRKLPLVASLVNGSVLVTSLVILLFIHPGETQAEAISIVEYGRYDCRGDRNDFASYVHLAQTDTIRAVLGEDFGLKYIVLGKSVKWTVALKNLTIFPSPGLFDSTSGRFQPQSGSQLSPAIGDTNYTGYRFDKPQELLPGIWSMQIWFRGKMLAEKQFLVVSQH